MDKDKRVITYLRKVTPSTQRIQTSRATCLETPLPETPGGVEKITWKAFRKGKEKEILRLTDAGLKGEIAQG
jgi:hypothetical protein